MCGIAGYITSQTGSSRSNQLQAVIEALAHRGPDGQGLYENDRIGFAQTRLAISDRSSHSQQPLIDPQTGSALVFNGEIYNYPELRESLKSKSAFPLQGHGDLEVLFAGLLTKGITFLNELNGDFAFVFFDGRTRQVWMARDRLGVKPLYYAPTGADVLFASEIRALPKLGFSLHHRPAAWNSLLALRYCRENETVFQGVHRLPPAHYLRVDPDGRRELIRYWTPLSIKVQPGKDVEVREHLQELIGDSIRLRLRSERATGFFLSGGMDSGLIAEMARAGDTGGDWSAYTCAFSAQHPDVVRSRDLANQLRLKQEVYDHRSENFEVALRSLEEPVGDTVISPLYGLCRKASRETTVLLTGEGADEIFGGYAHHAFIPLVLKMPQPFLNLAAPATGWVGRVFTHRTNPLYPVRLGGEAVSRIERCFQSKGGLPDIYHIISDIFSVDERAELLGSNAVDLRAETQTLLSDASELSPIKQLIYLELTGWLPHYNLLKLDKLTSAFGMEGRVPYLDHRIVEFVFSLEDRHLWNFTRRKPLLQKVARKRPNLKTYPKIPFFHAQTDFQNLRDEVLMRINRGEIPDGFRPDALKRLLVSLDASDFIHRKKLELLYLSTLWWRLHHEKNSAISDER